MPESTTPDTAAYLYLGLTVIVVFMGGLVGSMILRYRSLKQDEALIEQLASEE